MSTGLLSFIFMFPVNITCQVNVMFLNLIIAKFSKHILHAIVRNNVNVEKYVNMYILLSQTESTNFV
jgi:hypothetical protein